VVDISVVIPTHERPSMVVRAVASALAQPAVREVIVVDDGSGPEVAAAVRDVRDKRVRFLRQDQGGGCRARNLGARHATADWLVFLDDDDELVLDGGDGVAAVLGHSRCGVVSWASRDVDQAGTEVGLRRPRAMGAAYDDVVALFDSGTFAVRRDAFEGVGGYADGLPSGPHHELALRLVPAVLAAGLTVCTSERVLVLGRRRPPGARGRQRAESLLGGARYVIERHRERLERDPRLLADHLAIAAVGAARLGDDREARRLLREAVRATPGSARHRLRLLLAYLPPLARRLWSRHEP
jgi:hypothetical protein